jgi:hypothetical protein
MDDDLNFASQSGFIVPPDKKVELKNRLLGFYTIQEQRDYVQGIDNAMLSSSCKPNSTAIEEFTLF